MKELENIELPHGWHVQQVDRSKLHRTITIRLVRWSGGIEEGIALAFADELVSLAVRAGPNAFLDMVVKQLEDIGPPKPGPSGLFNKLASSYRREMERLLKEDVKMFEAAFGKRHIASNREDAAMTGSWS